MGHNKNRVIFLFNEGFYQDIKASLKDIPNQRLVAFYQGLKQDVTSELKGHSLAEKVLSDVAEEARKRGLTIEELH